MNKALKQAVATARAEYSQGRTAAALNAIITGLEEVAKLEPKAPAPATAKKAAKKAATAPAPESKS
jgi:hypothetical protein